MNNRWGAPVGKVASGSTERRGSFFSRPTAMLSLEPCTSSRTS